MLRILFLSLPNIWRAQGGGGRCRRKTVDTWEPQVRSCGTLPIQTPRWAPFLKSFFPLGFNAYIDILKLVISTNKVKDCFWIPKSVSRCFFHNHACWRYPNGELGRCSKFNRKRKYSKKLSLFGQPLVRLRHKFMESAPSRKTPKLTKMLGNPFIPIYRHTDQNNEDNLMISIGKMKVANVWQLSFARTFSAPLCRYSRSMMTTTQKLWSSILSCILD